MGSEGPSLVLDYRASIDDQGQITAWEYSADRVTATLREFPRTGRWELRQSSLRSFGMRLRDCGRSGARLIQNPIDRNFGETMGVFLPVDLSSKSPAEGLFQSNGAILELERVEKQLERLAPPSWPEEVLGKIDRDKAKAGKALFVEHCASCHNVWPYRWTEPNKYGKRFVLVGLTPQTYVGTDKAQIEALKPLAFTGELSKFLPPEFRDKPFLPPLLIEHPC